ncbi:hypothetical protein AAV94_12785 [Lampropedia cohaerens]|uniref:Peptidase A2 domain-containing protein n=1 Tax=Lampropedia cohaerens TaxID=1610491 RepID=A0A0U1PWN4_9BURK|nr:TIGR02281 family clan AA aspartic protease [Lampropedia cohaerens]KKW66944.1 hypothetical protein AAV94_12785 [Lampropedia cohaerens]
MSCNRMRLCCLALALCTGSAGAQDVRVVGTIGNDRAIIMVDGSAPRTLRKGESLAGVQLLQVQGDLATVRIHGQPVQMRVGATPTRLDAPAHSVRLQAADGGHYFADGQINGQPVHFLVDTGASTIALDQQTASRLKIAYTDGEPTRIRTANGQTTGWLVTLAEVRVGALRQSNVRAAVIQQAMPFVLLGNSFLNHYRLTRDANTMVLTSP